MSGNRSVVTRSWVQFPMGLAGYGVVLLLLGMSPTILGAQQPVPVGPEFQVNTYTTMVGYYIHPKVAADTAGNFVVLWPRNEEGSDDPGLFGQRFGSAGDRLGGEFQVNTDSKVYQDAYNNAIESVVSDPAGNFVVVWGGYRDYCYKCIFGQRFDTAANPVGGEFQVNSPDPYEDYNNNPEIAMDGAGNFIVAWEGRDADPEGVVARRFDSNGNPLGEHFVVNTYTTHYQGDHGWVAVAAAPAGNFLVVWVDERQDDYADNVYGQHFDSAGSPQGGEFRVNTYTPGGASDPAVSTDSTGNFVVAWVNCCGRDGDGYGILAQRYDSAGSALGGEFQVNTYTTWNQGYGRGQSLSVACEPAGDFVVVWEGRGEGDSYGVFGQRFDSSGNRAGSEFQVNEYTTSYQRYPNVASTGPGEFVVVWTSYEHGDYGYDTVFGQRFAVLQEQELLLSGKRLLIKNRVPDDKEKNKGVWLVKDPSIVAGTRETPDDPRCNGDPPGTVKASIRFFSDDSGHDTGTIVLPCENWSALGPDSYPNAIHLGYKYRDKELNQGSCKLVILRDARLVKVSCYGKGETTDFTYDLVVGTDEGIVNVVMTTGLIKYCTAFDGFKGNNGSDGKKFKGRNSPVPLSCPELPPSVCGDGVVEGEEGCDDGNTDDGDCCSSSCEFDPVGVTCDDGDFCTAVDQCDGAGTCMGGGSRCGDGNLDTECGEECDTAGETSSRARAAWPRMAPGTST